MDFYPQLDADLRKLVQTVFNLPPEQVMTTNQAISDNIVQDLRRALNAAGNAAYDPSVIPLPRGIIQLGSFKNTTMWGIQGDLFLAPITIWYVMAETDKAAQGLENQTVLNGLLFNLWNAVRNNFPGTAGNYDSFQQIENADIDSSDTEPLNMYLRGLNKLSLIAGSVSWSPGLLVGSNTPQNGYP